MPEVVILNKALQIIEVQSFESVSFDHISHSIAEVQGISEKEGIKRVLVDASNMTSSPAIFDMFDLAKRFPRHMRIAVVTPGKKQTLLILQFGATVARNRGINIYLFQSKDEAVKWLQE